MDVISFFRRQLLAPVAGLPPDAIPVTASRQLLEEPGCAPLVRQMAQLMGFPPDHWQSLVLAPLHRYAAFAQRVPLPGEPDSSVLEAALRLSVAALRIRRARMLPPGASPEALARGADRWTWAILTVALLHGVGERLLARELQMLGAGGTPLGHWNPWLGPMTEQAGCIAYRIGRESRRDCAPGRGILFAHKVVPESGIGWLAEDAVLLDTWLECLSGKGAGALGEILGQGLALDKVEGRVGQVGHNSGPEKPGQALPVIGGKVADPADPVDRFMGWLAEMLAAGSLPVNRPGSPVYGVDGGWVLLVIPGIFGAYQKSGQGVGDLAALRKQFLKRGLHRMTSSGGHSFRFSRRSGDAIEGYLVPIHALGLDEGLIGTGDLRGPLEL